MEEEKMKLLIREEVLKCIEELKQLQPGSQEHERMTADIKKLTEAYDALDRTEHAKMDSDRKFKEEIRRTDLEREYKDILERDKLRIESEAEERNKKIRWGEIGVRAICSLLPLAAHTVFLGLGMRLEFLEHGSLTGYTTKELMKALYPKPPMM